jgi:hypothetical protein
MLVAVFAVKEQAAELAPKYSPLPFFPGLASQLTDASRIHIASRKATFDVVLARDGNWIVPQRMNYPASRAQIQLLLVGLAGLETIEPKTARPEWFHYVNLDAPPKGNGVLIAVSEANGHDLASVIFGSSEDIGDAGGAIGLFARKPSEDQSWLVRSVFEPKSDPGDWMDKSLLSLDRARVQEVDVKPIAGTAYNVVRDKPGDASFRISPVPKGREPSSDAAADGLASALTGFTFDDAKPASQLDFSKASRVVTKTFDGLTVTANVIQTGQDYWTQLTASGDASHPDAAKEAGEINAHAGKWAYKLPAYKGQQFMATLESLLKPLGTPAKSGE